jgi:hypothetical protein
VAALAGTRRDSSWCPPGVDNDLLYDDGYVTAAFNPTPQEITEHHVTALTWGGFWHGVWVTVKWVFYLATAVILVAVVCKVVNHLLFVKRWDF